MKTAYPLTLAFRAEPETAERLREIADAQERPLSVVIRRLVRAALENELPEARTPAGEVAR
jgi:predicted transcriptional regulator